MPEWWSYELSDFLLFSPRTYYRLIQRHNAALWPLHLVTVVFGVAAGVGLRRSSPGPSRGTFAVLALLWGWVGWSFVWERYATINWAATYLAALWLVEVPLLVWLGVYRGTVSLGSGGADWSSRLGLALLVIGLAVYPLLAHLLGRGWSQAETFGMTPDPTAVATIGLLLQTKGPGRWAALIPPLLWCLVAAATLYAMGSPEAWAPAAAAAVALTGLSARAIAAT